jgi:hypothetical protein
VRGPCSSFPIPMLLVPPSFLLFGPCRLSCPCAWYALSPFPSPFLFPSPSWSWSLHPPIHPASSCSQRRWGVLGCGSGCSPCASRPCRASLPHASGPVVPSSPSLVLPVSTPQAVAHGSGLGGRRGRHSATGQGQRRRGRVMGAYLVGIPLQGSPGALRTPFIICTSSSFVPHRRLVLRSLSYVVRCRHLYLIVVWSFVHCRMLFVHCRTFVFVCTLLLFVCCCLYVIVVWSFVRCRTSFIVLRTSLFVRCRCRCSYVIVRHSSLYVVVHRSSSFIRCPCGNVPRNIVENSLLVKDKKDERCKKPRLGPKRR